MWRHAPSLAPLVVVYPGLRELGSAHGASTLAAALDGAAIVLTTYRVLQQEVLYDGGATAAYSTSCCSTR